MAEDKEETITLEQLIAALQASRKALSGTSKPDEKAAQKVAAKKPEKESAKHSPDKGKIKEIESLEKKLAANPSEEEIIKLCNELQQLATYLRRIGKGNPAIIYQFVTQHRISHPEALSQKSKI